MDGYRRCAVEGKAASQPPHSKTQARIAGIVLDLVHEFFFSIEPQFGPIWLSLVELGRMAFAMEILTTGPSSVAEPLQRMEWAQIEPRVAPDVKQRGHKGAKNATKRR